MKKSKLRQIIREAIKVEHKLYEKKIGFNRGPEYSEEAVDLLHKFAATADMLNQEIENKILKNDDPSVQEIINVLDNNLNLNSDLILDLEKVLDLIQLLPDRPRGKERIGFVQRGDEDN